MKEFIKGIFYLIICLNLSQPVSAQLTYRWDAGVEVTLPDDFEVDKNIAGEFTASAEGMEFNMFIFEEDISLDDMNDYTMEIAKEMDVADLEEIRNIKTKSGFEGKYVEGNADGTVVIVAGLIDPESTNNFFVVISYYDDDDLAAEDSIKILNSLTH